MAPIYEPNRGKTGEIHDTVNLGFKRPVHEGYIAPGHVVAANAAAANPDCCSPRHRRALWVRRVCSGDTAIALGAPTSDSAGGSASGPSTASWQPGQGATAHNISSVNGKRMGAKRRGTRVQNAGSRVPTYQNVGDTGEQASTKRGYLCTRRWEHKHTHTCKPVLTRGRAPLPSREQGFRVVFPVAVFAVDPTAEIQHIGFRGASDGEGCCKRRSGHEPMERHGNKGCRERKTYPPAVHGPGPNLSCPPKPSKCGNGPGSAPVASRRGPATSSEIGLEHEERGIVRIHGRHGRQMEWERHTLRR